MTFQLEVPRKIIVIGSTMKGTARKFDGKFFGIEIKASNIIRHCQRLTRFCNCEEREPKMGCECELEPEEVEVLKSIFSATLKLGRTPTVEELRSYLQKSAEEIIRVLDELEKKDAFLRNRGTQEIVSIYPLSLTPTEHKITLEDGTQLFAMCAVDALGIPMMFNKDVKIVSRCEKCKQEITIEIKNEEIASISHPDLTICSPKRQVYPAAEMTCPLVNFFCSKKHAEEWIAENPKLKNNIKQGSVMRGFPKIKGCWKGYGEMLGIR